MSAFFANAVLVLGEQHLLDVLVEYCRYFNETRTHQSLGQLVPAGCSTAAGVAPL